MHTQQNRSEDYNEVVAVLGKRAATVRRSVFLLIYFLVTVVACVAVVAYNIKNSPNSPFANFISAALDANQNSISSKEINKIINNMYENNKKINDTINTDIQNKPKQMDDEIKKPTNRNTDFFSAWRGFNYTQKSTSEKIAESIASIVISLSVFMFIGFVMRAILVFIKYYMQLGTDFENQKVAYILSKGDHEKFSNSLTLLRDHNIKFEKTPTMPQERIITSLLDVIKSKNGSEKA